MKQKHLTRQQRKEQVLGAIIILRAGDDYVTESRIAAECGIARSPYLRAILQELISEGKIRRERFFTHGKKGFMTARGGFFYTLPLFGAWRQALEKKYLQEEK